MSSPRDERVARIVGVGAKEMTDREAVAECVVSMTPEACAQLVAGTPKGNPLEAARIAGVMGVKRTPDLLPFCHPIAVTGAEGVRHGEGVRSRGADRRVASAREARRQERSLRRGVSARNDRVRCVSMQ